MGSFALHAVFLHTPASQNAVPVGPHWMSLVHEIGGVFGPHVTHWLLVQIGVFALVHWALEVHATHAPVLVLQTGVVPEHCALEVHPAGGVVHTPLVQV